MRVSLRLCILFFFAFECHAQTILTDVFSTGVGNSGNLLSQGQTDPHWTISSSPDGAIPALVTTRNALWVTNTPSSQWINATGSGDDIEPGGVYIYTLTFSLAGFNPSTTQIAGEWSSDNASEIYINGVDTGYSDVTHQFHTLVPFSITNDFQAGENELQFYVTQGTTGSPNPEGLQVDILSATAQPVPEPGVFSLVPAFFAGLLLFNPKQIVQR